MQHPNLYFSQKDIENYKKRIQNDEKTAEKYRAATADAEKFLNEEFISEERANGGVSQHADFGLLNRQANRFFSSLGIKYAVENDVRCAEKMKQMLLHYIGFERWYSSSYSVRTPVPWHADLCSTASTLAFAAVYDIIYGYLTPDERKTIARGILDKGVIPAFSDWVLPEKRIHALDSMGHNWWSVCIAEASTAALALADEFTEECSPLFALADEALADYLTYKGNPLFNKLRNFDEQGLFYESMGYNNFGTGSLLRYLWCSERFFGENKQLRNALPEGLCEAFMNFAYPVSDNGKTRFDFLNFGDSDVINNFSFFAKYACRLGIADDGLKALTATYKADIAEDICGYDPADEKGSLDKLPLEKIFSSGYAVARKSYENDSTLFAVKSGFCWNHSHNDSGTFVIFHKGRPLFDDDGTCSYDSPLYHAYYCQDCAHSVLRLGSGGRRDEELYRGTKFPGALTDSFSAEDFFFVQADSAGPMAHLVSRMYRNFIWIENRILVIFDDVFCHDEDTVEFTVHADARFENNGSETVFDNGISKARLVSHLPGMNYSVRSGHPDRKQEENKPYAVFETEEKQRTHLLINTIELDYEDNPLTFRNLVSENADGIEISGKNCVREIWYNRMADGHIMHDNSNNVIAGFDTDAYMLMITRRKNCPSRVFAVNSSYLRCDGKAVFSSFVKKTGEYIFIE